eukprot:scaffold139_cov246-Pinguiococcus_pyrenoidosus.AAC.4
MARRKRVGSLGLPAVTTPPGGMGWTAVPGATSASRERMQSDGPTEDGRDKPDAPSLKAPPAARTRGTTLVLPCGDADALRVSAAMVPRALMSSTAPRLLTSRSARCLRVSARASWPMLMTSTIERGTSVHEHRHAEEVDVSRLPELLEERQRHEGQQGVLAGLEVVVAKHAGYARALAQRHRAIRRLLVPRSAAVDQRLRQRVHELPQSGLHPLCVRARDAMRRAKGGRAEPGVGSFRPESSSSRRRSRPHNLGLSHDPESAAKHVKMVTKPRWIASLFTFTSPWTGAKAVAPWAKQA